MDAPDFCSCMRTLVGVNIAEKQHFVLLLLCVQHNTPKDKYHCWAVIVSNTDKDIKLCLFR